MPLFGKTREEIKQALESTVAIPSRQAIALSGLALVIAVIALAIVMSSKGGK